MNNNPDQNGQPGPLRIAVVIPTYNNGGTIAAVIGEVKQYLPEIIVVNDGSTDTTAEILASIPDILYENFPRNQGKGRALHAGFLKAAALGYTHSITFDGDGQHLAEDIPAFVAKIREEPGTLWIGNRMLPCPKSTEPPARSSFGRNFGNFWYKFIANIALNDTQCGFRAYPLRQTLAIDSKRKRYDYEQELLIRSAWNGTPVKEVAVHLYYQPRGEKVSHFQPVRDFLRISRVNGKYGFIRTVNPFVVLEVPGKSWKDKLIYLIRHELAANSSPKNAALSVAAGVFMALSPLHGFQVVITMGLSFLFHLNRPLAFLGVSVSSAPLIPFIILAEVAIGKAVIPDGILGFAPQGTGLHAFINGALIFVTGSILFAVAMSILTYTVAYSIFERIARTRQGKSGLTHD